MIRWLKGLFHRKAKSRVTFSPQLPSGKNRRGDLWMVKPGQAVVAIYVGRGHKKWETTSPEKF